MYTSRFKVSWDCVQRFFLITLNGCLLVLSEVRYPALGPFFAPDSETIQCLFYLLDAFSHDNHLFSYLIGEFGPSSRIEHFKLKLEFS